MTDPHSPSQRTLSLPQPLRDAIISHARDEAPRECCGVVVGREGIPVEAIRLTNIAPGNRLYEIDPAQLLELEFTTLPNSGHEVVAIYHSHPETEAYPSATDRAQAFWPDAVYLICSLAEPSAPVIRGFKLDSAAVVEVILDFWR